MLKQFCRACGNEVYNNGTFLLEYCTNCGAHLPRQTQGFAAPNQTVPMFGGGANRKTGGDRTLFWVLISIPAVLILTGLVGFGILFYAATKARREATVFPPSRTNPTPNVNTKTSNALLSFGKEGFGQGEFKNAEALAVDKEGNIYVGDGTMRIQKFDREGRFVQLWNVTESKEKPDEKYFGGITGMVIDSKNRLYVAVKHQELLRYEAATGKFIDKIQLYGEKWMNTAQEATILDMVMLNDDRLAVFATAFPRGEYVIMVSPEGKPEIKHKSLLKKQDSNADSLMRGGILVNVTGEIFLMNGVATEKTYIYRYKADGSYVDRFTWDGAPTRGFFSNKIVALNSKGEIYAYNRTKSQIAVLNAEGVQVRAIPLKSNFTGQIILDAEDNIYLLGGNKVEKFPAAGA